MELFEHMELRMGADAPLTYVEGGTGEAGTIVLATSWPSAIDLYHDLAELLIGAGWRVLVPELRRHSIADQDHLGDWLDLQSRDIERMCEQYTDEACVFVGHGLAGLVGFRLMQRCPEVVQAMIGVSCPARGAVSMRPGWVTSRAYRLRARLGLSKPQSSFWTSDKAVQDLLEPVLREPVPLAHQVDFDDVDFLEVVATSAVPVLLIEGENDPLNQDARRLTAVATAPLRWVDVRSLPASGHFVMLEAAEALFVILDAALVRGDRAA